MRAFACVRACVCLCVCVCVGCKRACMCVCGGGIFLSCVSTSLCVRSVCLSCIYSFLFKTVLIYLLVICSN